MVKWDFDVLEAPLLSHGSTLDRLFRSTKAGSVLLLDSDAEIRDPAVMQRMRLDLQNPAIFGAGYLQGASWLGGPSGCAPNVALFEERPWMPWVMFRTDHVRRALAAGASFDVRVVYNDLIFSKALSRQLAKRLQTGFTPPSRIVRRLPDGVRRRLWASTLHSLRWARKDFHGLRPNVVYLDTGAEIYQWCKYQDRKRFSGPPLELLEADQMVHYQGITRAKLYGGHNQLRRPLADIESDIQSRLRTEYGLTDSMVPRAAGLAGDGLRPIVAS
jgi:hypothetical protein